jgi:hypothetical protein
MMKALSLKGSLLGAIRNLMIRGRSLTHNNEPVATYRSKKWFLVPFPEEKGAPYVADNLATVSSSSFREDSAFQAALRASESRWEIGGMQRDISWRLHTALFAARLGVAGSEPGDKLIELGTGPGFMAAGILQAFGPGLLRKRELDFFLMDTFLPNWQEENQLGPMQVNPKYYANGVDDVRDYFSRYPNVHVVVGQLPASLKELPSGGKIAFLHVDLNSASAERSSLQQIKGRLRSRSVVLFDDATNPGCQDQLEVHRKFAREFETTLLELPTGQALMLCP